MNMTTEELVLDLLDKEGAIIEVYGSDEDSENHMLVVNDYMVDTIKQITQNKLKFWGENFPSFKFDKYGRCVIGTHTTIDIKRLYSKLYDGLSLEFFFNCFIEYMKEKGYTAVNLEVFGYTDIGSLSPASLHFLKLKNIYNKGNFAFKKNNGSNVEVKATRVLSAVHDKLKGIYNKDELKDLSLFKRLDVALNSFTGNGVEVILSINPLDRILCSGEADEEVDEMCLSHFHTCLSTALRIDEDNDNKVLGIISRGCHANITHMLTFSSLNMSCFLFIPNGNKSTIGDIPIYGYKTRTSGLVFDEDKILLEKEYPVNIDSFGENVLKLGLKPVTIQNMKDVLDNGIEIKYGNTFKAFEFKYQQEELLKIIEPRFTNLYLDSSFIYKHKLYSCSEYRKNLYGDLTGGFSIIPGLVEEAEAKGAKHE